MKTINILGTKYTIREINDTPEYDGICKIYENYIGIRRPENMLCNEDATEAKMLRYKEVLRHELIHAFFNESAAYEYTEDERLVDWIAKQFPKLIKAFEEVDCL